MPELTVGQAATNPTPGSVVAVKVEDYVCTLNVEQNNFGDTLPTIPADSRTERNKILYQLKLRAKLIQHTDGNPVAGYKFSLKSNRPNDRIESKGTTNKDGELIFTLTTRDSGQLKLTSTSTGITMAEYEVNLKEAWYESPFLITGYNVCLEIDFSGELVEGAGLDEKHKEDFLYSALGIPMQGTGKDINGKLITIVRMASKWHHNARGNPDRVETPSGVTFMYTDGFHGAFGDVKEDDSIAVDPNVIPKRAKVHIDGLGIRWARDKGGKIKGYHIDNFLGFGKDVVKKWLKGGINGTHRRIKYLGDEK